MDDGIPESVNPLEVSWLVDGDVSVDGHTDDDVDTAGHKRVDQRNLEVSLVEGGGIITATQSIQSAHVEQGWHSCDEHAQV